jgi:hypothetical protein
MSLTEEGYRERKWGRFPTLRQALEDKKIPSTYFGFTSASDNMFDAMGRLLEISVLAVEYQSHIKKTTQSAGQEEMYKDLLKLEEDLEQAMYFFKRKIDEVRAIYNRP